MANKPLCVLAAALCLAFPATALAKLTLTGSPGEGAVVMPGDEIAYELSLDQSGAVGSGTDLLRVRLSQDVTLQPQSVVLASGTLEGAEPEIVFGTDGFVVLLPQEGAVESVVFTGTVDEAAQDIACTASAGEEQATLSYESGYEPPADSPAPAARTEDAPEMEAEPEPAADQTLLVVLIGAVFLILVGVCVWLYRNKLGPKSHAANSKDACPQYADTKSQQKQDANPAQQQENLDDPA